MKEKKKKSGGGGECVCIGKLQKRKKRERMKNDVDHRFGQQFAIIYKR